MPQLTIVSHGDSAAVVLPASVLEPAGFHVGRDVLDVTLGERELISPRRWPTTPAEANRLRRLPTKCLRVALTLIGDLRRNAPHALSTQGRSLGNPASTD